MRARHVSRIIRWQRNVVYLGPQRRLRKNFVFPPDEDSSQFLRECERAVDQKVGWWGRHVDVPAKPPFRSTRSSACRPEARCIVSEGGNGRRLFA